MTNPDGSYTSALHPVWVFPAGHGVTISGDLATLSNWETISPAADRTLPAGNLSERPLAFPQPPLPITLSAEELRELSDTRFQTAATNYGPDRQDKDSNQDFALAAELTGEDATSYAFAVVADGVSTRTLWAERAARLACFATYKFVRHWLAICATPFEDAALQRDGAFRTGLVEAIRAALAADREILNRLNLVSHAWSADVYGSAMDEDALWYNTTLIVACLGGGRGLYVSVGDGGATLFRQGAAGREAIVLLSSEATLTIDHSVSLVMSPNDFTIRPINLQNASDATIILSSDGVDRTVQRVGRAIDYDRFEGVLAAGAAASFLHDLLSCDESVIERDNMSVAVAKLPPTGNGGVPKGVPPPDFAGVAESLLRLLRPSARTQDWEIAQTRRARRLAVAGLSLDETAAAPVSVVESGASREEPSGAAPSSEAGRSDSAGPSEERARPPEIVATPERPQRTLILEDQYTGRAHEEREVFDLDLDSAALIANVKKILDRAQLEIRKLEDDGLERRVCQKWTAFFNRARQRLIFLDEVVSHQLHGEISAVSMKVARIERDAESGKTDFERLRRDIMTEPDAGGPTKSIFPDMEFMLDSIEVVRERLAADSPRVDGSEGGWR